MKAVNYAALTHHHCSICKRRREVRHFHKYKDASAPLTGWRYFSRCIDCNKKACKSYAAGNKPKRNARLKAWRKKNPEAAKLKDRKASYKRNYNLTLEQVEKLKAQKDQCCWICGEKPKKLNIDHCHKTGRVRGCLCSFCNSYLGRIEANPKILEAIREYLGQACHADVLLELANQ